MDYPTSTSDTSETVYPLVFISSFISFGVRIHLQYLFDGVTNQFSNSKYLFKLIETRSKVHAKSLLRERALNFDQGDKFCKNYRSVRS